MSERRPRSNSTACTRASARPQIIRGVDSRDARGERHAIIGPNGAGKSTLFNLISGRFPLDAGRILLERRRRSTGCAPHRDQPPRPVAQLPDHQDLPAHDGVREHPLRAAVVARLPLLVLAPARAASDARTSAPSELLETLGLDSAARRAGRRCSPTPSSARSRSASRSPAAPNVILLDEPTAGMSRSETDARGRADPPRHARARRCVMVEHDMSVVFDLADRISVLVYGEVIATDAPAAIRANRRCRKPTSATESRDATAARGRRPARLLRQEPHPAGRRPHGRRRARS